MAYQGPQLRRARPVGRIMGLALAVCMSALGAQAAGPKAVNGVCGPANGVATSTAPSSGLCSAGRASVVTQSGPSWIWSCAGLRGGSTAQCSAPISPPPRTLTITFTPPNPSIPDTSPLGTFVARVTAAWSNGDPFTGTLAFAAPYFDDGGTFALSGDQLIVSPTGMGVSGDGGTIQRVSIEASP